MGDFSSRSNPSSGVPCKARAVLTSNASKLELTYGKVKNLIWLPCTGFVTRVGGIFSSRSNPSSGVPCKARAVLISNISNSGTERLKNYCGCTAEDL